jgi:hypothetical protein
LPINHVHETSFALDKVRARANNLRGKTLVIISSGMKNGLNRYIETGVSKQDQTTK